MPLFTKALEAENSQPQPLGGCSLCSDYSFAASFASDR